MCVKASLRSSQVSRRPLAPACPAGLGKPVPVNDVGGAGGSCTRFTVDTLDARSLLVGLRPASSSVDARPAQQPIRPSPVPELAASTLLSDDDAEHRSPVNDHAHVVDSKEAPQHVNHYARRGAAHLFWERVGLPEPLRASLRQMRFTHPTPIQQEALPSLLLVTENEKRRDAVISSETGSGKTLVFALPVLCDFLAHCPSTTSTPTTVPVASDESPQLHSLVLTPTRELATQIAGVFEQLIAQTSQRIPIGIIVGGLAAEKQQRLLNRCPPVVVGTPGRIWDMLPRNEGCFLGHGVTARLRFLVLDEADRMLQSGRFQELQHIIRRVRRTMKRSYDLAPSTLAAEQLSSGKWDPVRRVFTPDATTSGVDNRDAGGDDAVGQEEKRRKRLPRSRRDVPQPVPAPPFPPETRRTRFIVLGATLGLQTRFQLHSRRGRQTLSTHQTDAGDRILRRLGTRASACRFFAAVTTRDDGEGVKPPPTFLDASPVPRLSESFVRCPAGAKDLYLYSFLRTHAASGQRTIVFVNAISMLRRLVGLLTTLQLDPAYLHAEMQQRQRLKMIERFRRAERPVLIATDVAARGLDVPEVIHVVHYQLPRTTDAYIHRCGRTARIGGSGFSLLLVGPDEYAAFRLLAASLSRENEAGKTLVGKDALQRRMNLFPVDPLALASYDEALRLAEELDRLEREQRKAQVKVEWSRRALRTGCVTKEEEHLKNSRRNARNSMERREEEALHRAMQRRAITQLKKRLSAVLCQQETRRGPKGAYPSAPDTSGAAEATRSVAERARRQIVGLATCPSRKRSRA